MSSEEIEKICNGSDMIVCGYAFSRTDNSNVRVFDLNEPHHASVMTTDGDVLETTMNDVEISIVKEYWKKNYKFMEESYA